MDSSRGDSDHMSLGEDRQRSASASPVTPSALPAEVNSFIGRSDLLDEATRLLGTARLITLIGAGGVGKTRLLDRLAADLAEAGSYQHVVIVRLTELRESDDRLESVIADALGILDNSASPGLDRLVAYFRYRRTLLMLDNCEHLVGGGTPGSGQVPRLVTTLLKAAPGLQVVTTSRVRLAVRGEHVLLVTPLCVGDTTSGETASSDRDHEAVRLLIDRAAAVGVEISEEDRPLATQLCRVLSGIPLAIELAAVQLDTMTLREMVDHPDLLALLVDGPSEQHHHRTMHAAMHWSYTLLTEPEQRMWGLAAVFVSGFDLEAAQAVCRDQGVDENEVLALLARLVRKSVLVAESSEGRTRYRMLELIRQYGLELVADAGMGVGLRQAHADYFDALTERCAREWFGPGEVAWMRRMRAELPNLRAAQNFFLSQPGMEGRALDLAINASRTRVFFYAGLLNEARRMLDHGLEAHPDTESPATIAALSLTSWIALCQGDQVVAAPLLARAEAAARDLGSYDSSGSLLYSRGVERWLTQANVATARESLTLLTQAEHAFRADGLPGDAFMAALFRTMATAFLDRDTAVAEATRLLADAQAVDARWAISWGLWVRALVELQFGDPEQAAVLAQDGLRIQREIGDTWGRTWSVWVIATIAVEIGEYELAARLFGGAKVGLRLTHANMLGLLPFLRRQQQAEAEVRRALGDDEFERQVSLGDSLSWSEAVELAFQLQPRKRDPDKKGRGGLSEREFQVAGLVATGISNREIAKRLHISYRTVEEHIRNINRKVGVPNRTQLAVWYLAASKIM